MKVPPVTLSLILSVTHVNGDLGSGEEAIAVYYTNPYCTNMYIYIYIFVYIYIYIYIYTYTCVGFGGDFQTP